MKFELLMDVGVGTNCETPKEAASYLREIAEALESRDELVGGMEMSITAVGTGKFVGRATIWGQ